MSVGWYYPKRPPRPYAYENTAAGNSRGARYRQERDAWMADNAERIAKEKAEFLAAVAKLTDREIVLLGISRIMIDQAKR